MPTRSPSLLRSAALVLAGSILLAAPSAVVHAQTPHAPTVERVDAWISTKGSARIGVGIVNADGTNQTLSRRMKPGHRRVYRVGMVHRGSSNASVLVRGCAGATGIRVTYRLTDGTDVTTDVTGGGYTFRGVGDGATVQVLVSIALGAHPAVHTINCGVIASTRDRLDTVVARVVVR